MLSQLEQVSVNLAAARALRAEGVAYREIGRRLGLTTSQLGHIRRTLKREKAGQTRLQTTMPGATARDLSVGRSALPAGLRRILMTAGYRTLGALADRVADVDQPGLESMPGLGPFRMGLIRAVLDQFGLNAGPSDLQAEVEKLFPDLRD
ncbi:hypothetical protein [Sphingomonas glacialis]|uniref:Uncharacterized protein n=1 Tax=Sphingomonas glacialis TaxID=658225 RepID=A0A502FIP9_9SPHN|nr:hypothetical protein [Sphingomonas glacialis]TPG49076.1 hypothetical protein EAH76_19865 [Sphingomonas glacialis]